jgi:hypothetical protein
MSRRELPLRANPEHLGRIADSFALAAAGPSGDASADSPYWKLHRSLAGFEIPDRDAGTIRIRGESGFHFPGRSSSALEWIDTPDRLTWLAVSDWRSRAAPVDANALSPSIPCGRKGFFAVRVSVRRPHHRVRFSARAMSSGVNRAVSSRRYPLRRPPPDRTRDRSGHGSAGAGRQVVFPPFLAGTGRPSGNPRVSLGLPDHGPSRMPVSFSGWFQPQSGTLYGKQLWPPAFGGRLPSAAFDLAINTDSMQEMELAAIRRHSRGCGGRCAKGRRFIPETGWRN